MAFNSGIMWNMADSGAADLGGSDFDWYDSGHDFVSPADGGYPGGIPGYDAYNVGDVTPSGGGGAITGVNPDTGAVKMDFTGMAPGVIDTLNPGSLDFGPEAVTMPSGGVYDILNGPVSPTTDTTTNDWTPLTVGGQELTPADFTGAADNLVINQGPTLPGDQIDTTGFGDYLSNGTIPGTGDNNTIDDYTYGTGTSDNIDTGTIGPVVPTSGDEDIPTMTITSNKPTVTTPTIDTTLIPYNPNDIIIPVTPEDTTPTMVITDTRPKQPPVITDVPVTPDIIVPPVIIEPPYVPPEPPVPPVEPPVIVEPPIVEPPPPPEPPIIDVFPPVEQPPVIVEPPYVPPVPPVVQPPVTPPQPPVVNPVTGEMINPGWIQPRAFYNTTNPAQSKFFWGGHGPQFASGGANPFNAQAYNQVAAPSTPWGLGQVAAPLSPAEMQAAIAGTYVSRPGTAPATRAEAYQAQTQVAPIYGQVKAGPPQSTTTGPVTPTTTKEMYTADQKTAISTALGSDWQSRMDRAALNGDYATIVDIQKQIDAVLNPVVDRY